MVFEDISDEEDLVGAFKEEIIADKEPHEMEDELSDVLNHLFGNEIAISNKEYLRKMRRREKNFMIWNGKLLRCQGRLISYVTSHADQVKVMKSMYDDVGHWVL